MVESSDFGYICFVAHLVIAGVIMGVVFWPKYGQKIRDIGEDPLTELLLRLWLVFFFGGGIGYLFGRTTYSSYFVLGLLFNSSFAMFISVGTTLVLLVLLDLADPRAVLQLVLLRAAALALVIWVGWLVIVPLTSAIPGDLRALREGPQHASGTVEASETVGFRGMSFYTAIDGVRYRIADSTWWTELHPGQRVDFLRDSERTVAFEPGPDTLTRLAMVAAACSGVLWLVSAALLLRWLYVLLI